MNFIKEIKNKREFSGLPDSIVERALILNKNDIKETRAFLRKYFGVFLTNRIIKGRGDLLKIHMSSKKRDYDKFYDEIFSKLLLAKSVIDFGCGVNGLTFPYLHKKFGVCEYLGFEATSQVVDAVNGFFNENGYDKIANVMWCDLFNVEVILRNIRGLLRPRVAFMFQIVDALENIEKNFSKKFILEVLRECEWVVLTLPTESLGGGKKFAVRRNWIIDFLKENFFIDKDFEMSGERIICLRKTNN